MCYKQGARVAKAFFFMPFHGILLPVGGMKGATMSNFLTYEERLIIARGLKESLSFGAIAKEIGKDRTTVAKEIKKRSFKKKSGRPGYPYNACRHRAACKEKSLCQASCERPSAYKCSLCSLCNGVCTRFEEEICMARFKPPYACNGCSELEKCTLEKVVYDPADAHIVAEKTISEARSGILSSEAEIARINKLISPLVRNGQSIHQIYESHKDELMCSEKTLYNYIDASLFDVRNIDLPRKVRYRLRHKKPEFKVDKGCRIGRNYQDFKKFMDDNPETAPAQMDSVIGNVGGKVLLTIYFVQSGFMLAFLREANTSQSVIDIFNGLYRVLGHVDFCRLFPVILTDNGSEFSNPAALEFAEDAHARRRTNIFYCDPASPHQKGALEVNHEFIRRVIPKGKSFNELTREDISLMMNHINSYKRKKLNNRTPYETFSFYYGEGLAQKLGCFPVAAENIILKPRLLKK